jgi:hypothetical protein
VAVPYEDDYKRLKKSFGSRSDQNNLILSKNYSIKVYPEKKSEIRNQFFVKKKLQLKHNTHTRA